MINTLSGRFGLSYNKMAKSLSKLENIWNLLSLVPILALVIQTIFNKKYDPTFFDYNVICFGSTWIIFIARVMWGNCPITLLKHYLVKKEQDPNLQLSTKGYIPNLLHKKFGVPLTEKLVIQSLILLVCIQWSLCVYCLTKI